MPRPSSGSGRDLKKRTKRSPLELWHAFNQSLEEKRADAVVEPERIEPGRRVTALGIDFGVGFVASMFLMLLPVINIFMTSQMIIMIYLIFRDYFFEGRGVGKNLMGIQVVDIYSGNSPSLRQVVERNGIYIAPLLFCQVLGLLANLLLPLLTHVMPVEAIKPLTTTVAAIGNIVLAISALYLFVILPIESYRSYDREDSMRLGDEIAGTCLTNTDMSFSNFLSR
ncbi:RDD family protein [bacterium]|nr:RDD family protein [bacterium]MBP9806899.1 RDD family protein [bacterium]